MSSMFQALDHDVNASTPVAPMYRIVLTLSRDERAERRLRHVIERKRGDLKSLSRSATSRQLDRVHVYLGVRRIDDVVAALEGAGFAVDAVVGTCAPLPPRPL